MSSTQQILDWLPLSARDFHILLALTDGERHGYGLVKTIERASGGVLRLDPANLYRAIQKLAEAGLVQDAECKPAPEANAARRRYYRITDLGRGVATAEAERMRELAAVAEAKCLIPRSPAS